MRETSRVGKLVWGVQLIAVAYSGVVISGPFSTLLVWGMKHGAPLLVVLYSHLETAVVQFLDLGLLNSSLYLGRYVPLAKDMTNILCDSLLEAIAPAVGMCAVTWGQANYLERLAVSGGVGTLEPAPLFSTSDGEENVSSLWRH